MGSLTRTVRRGTEIPRVVLVDRTRYGLHQEALGTLRQRYRVEVVPSGADPVPVIERGPPPFAVCFDFDYPATAELADLQEVKHACPSVPIVMVTEQHSEPLAVWAFRSRVWDYFVVPLDLRHFVEVFELLADLAQQRRGAGRAAQSRAMVPPQQTLPTEVRFRDLSRERRNLNLVVSFIDGHLQDRIQQKEVASLCGMSPFQLSRAFQRELGISFQDYIVRRRIEESMRLLANPQASVTDVCYAVGFHDHSYFTRTFRKVVGCTPSSYVRSVREGARNDAASQPRRPEAGPLPPGERLPPEMLLTGLWAEIAIPPPDAGGPTGTGPRTTEEAAGTGRPDHSRTGKPRTDSPVWETHLFDLPEPAEL